MTTEQSELVNAFENKKPMNKCDRADIWLPTEVAPHGAQRHP